MADESRGDDVYQPENSDVDNGPSDDLDLENVIDERDLDDMMTEGYSPPEHPLGVNKYGVTGEEQRAGETLDQRLAQEAPEVRPETGDGVGDVPGGEGEPVDTETGDARAGRLEAVDDIAPRRHSHVGARDVGIDGGAASAEEAAVHIADDEEMDG
ncbi:MULTISPECIES: DUF5709 domain-containing protein [Streptomyces]|uniref:DUF5709 domain-containing protein n=1 Tax=Streptomyces TaxID=1883 RepID=UPI00084C3B9C|nr:MULTISPECIES: DUF5709 domain-containing protein [Streptomyces]TFI29049.1 hypothetical protein E4P36_08270 [Streptomyces sp. 4R-3d]